MRKIYIQLLRLVAVILICVNKEVNTAQETNEKITARITLPYGRVVKEFETLEAECFYNFHSAYCKWLVNSDLILAPSFVKFSYETRENEPYAKSRIAILTLYNTTWLVHNVPLICQCENSKTYRSIGKREIRIQVQYERATESYETAHLGSSFLLKCPFTPVPGNPSFFWTKKTKGTFAKYNERALGTNMFYFAKIASPHAGEYKCEIRHNKVFRHNIFIVKVTEKPVLRMSDTYITSDRQKQAMLVCTVLGGFPITAMTWEKRNGSDPITKKETVLPTEDKPSRALNVFSFSPNSIGGSYMCTVSNKLGKNSVTAAVIEYGPPSVSIQRITYTSQYYNIQDIQNKKVDDDKLLSTKFLEFSTHLILLCKVQSIPNVTEVVWKKDKKILCESRFLLSLGNVTAEDAGEYECLAENSAGKGSKITKIVVNYRPRVEMQPFNMVEGRSAIFVCSFRGMPGVTDANIYEPSGAFRYGMVQVEGTHSMLSARVENPLPKKDSGLWSCRARSKLGWSNTVHARVTVVRRGRRVTHVDVPQDITVKEGTNAVLPCSAYCKCGGAPNMKWTKTHFTNQPSLKEPNWSLSILKRLTIRKYDYTAKLSAVKPYHRGVYTCTADGKSVSAKVFVLSPPSLTIVNATRTLVEGDFVTIKCASTVPTLTGFEWYINDHLVWSASFYIRLYNHVEGNNASDLTFTVGKKHNKARVKCVCNQILFGKPKLTSESFITLNVHYIQRPQRFEDHALLVGENLTLVAPPFDGNPMVHFQGWFLNNKSKIISQDRELTIKDVKKNDSGAYTCMANNSAGTTFAYGMALMAATETPTTFEKPPPQKISGTESPHALAHRKSNALLWTILGLAGLLLLAMLLAFLLYKRNRTTIIVDDEEGEGPDDFGCMPQVTSENLKHGSDHSEKSSESSGSSSSAGLKKKKRKHMRKDKISIQKNANKDGPEGLDVPDPSPSPTNQTLTGLRTTNIHVRRSGNEGDNSADNSEKSGSAGGESELSGAPSDGGSGTGRRKPKKKRKHMRKDKISIKKNPNQDGTDGLVVPDPSPSPTTPALDRTGYGGRKSGSGLIIAIAPQKSLEQHPV